MSKLEWQACCIFYEERTGKDFASVPWMKQQVMLSLFRDLTRFQEILEHLEAPKHQRTRILSTEVR